MALESARDAAHVLAATAAPANVVIGFFHPASESSRRAEPEFERACAARPDVPAFRVDVSAVRDLHARFGVASVPTVVQVRGDRVLQRLVGPQPERLYARALFAGAASAVSTEGAAVRPAHRVTVYTSPTCSWCARVKSHLDLNRVPYREVDVSRDEDAARRLVARSGRQGVPQLDIDGHLVVGFDRPRIDALLGLAAAPA